MNNILRYASNKLVLLLTAGRQICPDSILGNVFMNGDRIQIVSDWLYANNTVASFLNGGDFAVPEYPFVIGITKNNNWIFFDIQSENDIRFAFQGMGHQIPFRFVSHLEIQRILEIFDKLPESCAFQVSPSEFTNLWQESVVQRKVESISFLFKGKRMEETDYAKISEYLSPELIKSVTLKLKNGFQVWVCVNEDTTEYCKLLNIIKEVSELEFV